MEKWKNSVLVESVLKTLYMVARRRTNAQFAEETIGSSIKTLENKYNFLKYVNIKKPEISGESFAISTSSELDNVNSDRIGKAIESLIRVVYNDLNMDVGLYFVKELKDSADEQVTRMISDMNIDLDQVQLEQHYAYQRQQKKKMIKEYAKTGKLDKTNPDNILGYTWDNISFWKHEPGTKYCTLYDKDGKILDQLNLERIIKNYIEKISGYIDVDIKEIEKETSIAEKEQKLLILLLERDMDAETAMHMLQVSKEELNMMIGKLSAMEMLQYVSFDTVELTEIGMGYLSKKEKQKNLV